MESIITYSRCPVCGSAQIKEAIQVKDHSVSGKQFSVWGCAECQFRFTQHVPDADSIGPYYQSEAYISHSNTQKGLVNRLYHKVRKITLANKRKLIGKITGQATGNLLDIGAGTGAFASYMAQSGWRVTGLEPDAQARKVASEAHRIQLLPIDELFGLPVQHYDAITMWHVLEHVHDLAGYMAQLKKLLKPGGCLFIAVPNYTSYDAERYKDYWAAYDVPRHLYHFSPQSMKKLLERNGLKLKACKPMWFDSFYVSMLSEKYLTGNSSIIKGAWVGALSNMKALSDKERCSSLIYCITL